MKIIWGFHDGPVDFFTGKVNRRTVTWDTESFSVWYDRQWPPGSVEREQKDRLHDELRDFFASLRTAAPEGSIKNGVTLTAQEWEKLEDAFPVAVEWWGRRRHGGWRKYVTVLDR